MVQTAGLVQTDKQPSFVHRPRHPEHLGLGPSTLLPRHHQSMYRFPAGVTMSLVSHCARTFHANKSNFSIDHILHVAGGKQSLESLDFSKQAEAEDRKFDWLSCTRYRPPKLPRQRKKEGIRRRNLGRNPRIPFSSSQVAYLEAKFIRTPYLSSNDVKQLASHLKLSETRVKIWFQNRRARERREKETQTKGDENSKRKISKIESPPPPTSPFPKSFPLDYSNPFRYITYAEPINYLQILTPLDLTERPK